MDSRDCGECDKQPSLDNHDSSDHEDDHRDDTQPPDGTEKLMKALGVLGRYQLLQILITCLSTNLFVCTLLNFVFIGYEPEHKCNTVNETDLLERYNLLNDSSAHVIYGLCDITITSNRTGKERNAASLDCYGGHNYSEHKYMSMVTEWDLVCDKRGVVGLIQSILTLGLGMGVVMFTSIADRFGRKYVYMFGVAALIVTELSLVFAPNIYVAIALRFFSGFTGSGVFLIICVVLAELVVTKYRQVFWAVECIWWSVNVMFLASISYLLKGHSWRYLQLVIPLSGVPIFLAAFALNETPVWYLAKGRYDDAKCIVVKACRMNKKNIDKVMERFQVCLKEAKLKTAGTPAVEIVAGQSNYTLIDVFHNKYILMLVLISGFLWFANSLAYYGLYLTSSTLAGNRFLNFFLMGLLEALGSLVCIVVVTYLGRRTVSIIFMAMSALCLLAAACLVAVESDNVHVAHASTAFFLLGKFAIGSSFNVISAYTPELLVTTIRSAGTGVSAMFARVGGMIAPLLLPLFQMVSWAPGAILAALCFICLILLPILPETKGRQLPNTFEEIMQWRKHKECEKNVTLRRQIN